MTADASQEKTFSYRDPSDVKSACEAHIEWEGGAELRTMQFLRAFPQTALSKQDTLPALPISELRHSQDMDPVIGSVMLFMLGGWPPPNGREAS